MVINKKHSLALLSLLLILLSGCKEQPMTEQKVLLIGESDTWNLSGYEIVLTPTDFKVGNGILQMKKENHYDADSLLFKTYIVLDEEEIIVHSNSESGEGIDIAQQPTGSIEGASYVNKTGEPITMGDISEIYMIVEWWDLGTSECKQERIDLYDKT